MSAKTSRPFRQLGFDRFEERIVMAGQPVSDVAAQAVEPPPIQTFAASLQTTATPDQFGLAHMREQYGLDGKGQTVAVIDTGIAWDHYALGGGFGSGHKVVGGWDFAENDGNPYDDGPAGYHGTHVSGIVASEAAGNLGVAPGADLVGLRVFDDNGIGKLEWVEQALRWVHQHKDSFANPITTINLSLGGAWNSKSLPDWAILEDEFAQLKQEGIFISVAAGNSFQNYLSKGLSYPAVSSHVVAVSSSNGNGQMSDFSQRDDKVIVAPGEDIRSTVPNHLFHGTSINRFLTASGTSMAAPYVAGASTLIREALTFMGDQQVTQQDIYDRMFANADKIYDQVSGGWYSHLNLPKAISAIMSDDYGNDVNSAHSLGGLRNTLSVEGRITSRADVDVFAFTAEKTGQVTIKLNSADPMVAKGMAYGCNASWNGNELTFQVVAGQQYKFSLGADNVCRHYSIHATLVESQVLDLGVVQSTTRSNDVVAGERNYRVTAGQNGFLTVAGTFQSGIATIDLCDAQGNFLQTAVGNRVDFVVKAGQDYIIKVSGAASYDLQIVNLVSLENGKLSVAGTIANDSIVLRSSNSVTVSVNSISYQFDRSDVKAIEIQGNGGSDSLQATLSGQNEQIAVGPNQLYANSSDQWLAAKGIASISVNGGGGFDQAVVYDSAGDDKFDFSRHRLVADLNSASVNLSQVEAIKAIAGNGFDSVILRDTHSDERLVGNNDHVMMVGSDFENSVVGFEKIEALASGGFDSAQLQDTKFDDNVIMNSVETRIVNEDSLLIVDGFDRINVLQRFGGNDNVTLLGTSGNDQVSCVNGGVSQLLSTGVTHRAVDFDNVAINGRGGEDAVRIVGSAGAKSLFADLDEVNFTSATGQIRMTAVEQVNYSGVDQLGEIVFADFSEGDLLTAKSTSVSAQIANLRINAEDVSFLTASTKASHTSEFEIAAVDFLFMLDGEWHRRTR
ncbi:MAG: S8 family serine peptidase [Pirellulaceae bacterium]